MQYKAFGVEFGQIYRESSHTAPALIETSYFKTPLSLKTTHSSCSHDQKDLKDKADERK